MDEFISCASCFDKKTINEEIQDIYLLNDKELCNPNLHLDDPSVLQTLHKIYHKIQSVSNNMNRKNYFICLSVYYNNLAYFHNKNDQPNQVENAIQNCIKNFQCIRGFLSTREENVAFVVELVKLYLQSCAIFSQGGKHKLSLLYAQKSLQKLIEAFRILQAICQDELCYVINRQPEVLTKQNYPTIKKVFFQTRVLKEAKQLLDQASSFPLVHKILSDEGSHFEKIINRLYFWKNNYDINEKIIRKQLDIDKKTMKRNILGLPKGNQIVQKFHIGTLMGLQLKKMSLNLRSDNFYLLSEEKLLEMIMYVSVCYFTLGTETRFDDLEEDIQNLKILDKYKKLTNDVQIGKCKILHIKAIEIAGKYLPTSQQYFNHLLYSFNKNYKPILDQIIQVSENPSILEQRKKSKNIYDEPSYQYGIIRPVLKTKQKLYTRQQPFKMQSVTVGKRKYKSQKKRKRIISTEKKANYK